MRIAATVIGGVLIFVVGFPLFYRGFIRSMAFARAWQHDPDFFAPGTRARMVRNILVVLFVALIAFDGLVALVNGLD